MSLFTPGSDRHTDAAAQTRVHVDFRQVREALAAVDQASTVFEGLLVAGAELQAENERLRDALVRIEHWAFDVRHTPESDLRQIKEMAHDVLG